MKVTMQCFTDLGSFSNPYDDYDCFTGTLTECKNEFRAWYELHCRYYDKKTAKEAISAHCYYGKGIGDYPDFQLLIGKRGGVIVSAT